MTASFVQSAPTNSASGNPVTVSLSGVVAHAPLILWIACGGATVTGVTGGGTWTKLTSVNSIHVGADLELWWCPNATGGSTTASVAFSGTPYSTSVALWLSEWSGLSAVHSVGTPQDPGTNTPGSSPTITPSVGDLVFMAAGFVNPPSANPTSPWVTPTGPAWYGNPAGSGGSFAYQIAPSTSPLTATWTTSADYASLGAAFTVSSGPAPAWQMQPLIPIFPRAPIGL